jgi:hypothetical protein
MIRIADSQSACARRIAAFALAALTTVTSLASAGPVSKFTNEGAYALAYGSDGCLYAFLDVSRGGPKSAPQTFLYYELYDMCSSWQLLAYGSGMIQNSAFRVDKKSGTLSVTTDASPTFFTYGATGTISLTFTPDREYQQTFTGHSSVSYLDRTIKWHGSSSYTTAKVSGTFIGWTIGQLSGELGEGRGKEITFEDSAK